MKILVSACLLGENCKYNGGNNLRQQVIRLGQEHELIPVCPEVAAGLGIPRIPIEIRNGEVVRSDGVSVDDAIRNAVAQILAKLPQNIDLCVLKARSPTCGVHQIYDGSFTGALVDGMGVLAQALKDAGYRVVDDEELTQS
jgi:uncharacterized protein YbbK (DUF523 family)